MNQRFRADQRLKSRRDFQVLIQTGERATGPYLDVRIARNSSACAEKPAVKLGIIVTRRISLIAARRNRWKRLIREAFRQLQRKITPRTDLLVRVRSAGTKSPEFKNVLSELESLLIKLGVIT